MQELGESQCFPEHAISCLVVLPMRRYVLNQSFEVTLILFVQLLPCCLSSHSPHLLRLILAVGDRMGGWVISGCGCQDEFALSTSNVIGMVALEVPINLCANALLGCNIF